MTETTDIEFQGWVILELMGHRRLGGYLKAEAIAGFSFLRIDVFGLEGKTAIATQFYPPSAVYCLTPTTEVIARHFGVHHQPMPVTRFDLPQMKTGTVDDGEDDDDYHDHEMIG